ncbi:MAG: MFS transporter [Novosphingobium sp.]
MSQPASFDSAAPPDNGAKPRLSLLRIVEMNLGFLGLQFSFGLQQGNMAPIYSWLGADEAALPILQLAGPMTGLIVQPLVGAISDRSNSRFGRRTPFFLIGAILCSIGLFLMPLSTSLLMAASLLWLLDAGNNITLEPYRAYVSDRLPRDQHAVGFLSQSAFTGFAQFCAFLTPSILVYWFGFDRHAVGQHNIPETTHVAFLIGAVLSISTIMWSVLRVPELPLSIGERAYAESARRGIVATLAYIGTAIREMPQVMRQMAWMSLFQWYAFTIYWSYAPLSIGRSVFNTADKGSDAFRDAVLTSQQLGALYNLVAFVAALAMMPLCRRIGPRNLHMGSLALAGLSLLYLPVVGSDTTDVPWVLRVMAMSELGEHLPLVLVSVGLGVGWASMMGNPYIILAEAAPPERTGVYMGIFNMMIVIPMLIASVTFGPVYRHVLAGDPRNAMLLAGALLICAAVSMAWVSGGRMPARLR